MFTRIIFIFNLLQDINILRPLIYMSSRLLNFKVTLVVTSLFEGRDKSGFWKNEIERIAEENNACIYVVDSELNFVEILQDSRGAIVAASESNLPAHKVVHDFFRIAPPQYTKITIQHGFECVGFLQSHEQDVAHGTNVSFSADIICGWSSVEKLSSVLPSQRDKLVITGPTSVLQLHRNTRRIDLSSRMGIVCENMHSPRLNVLHNFKIDFINIFDEFCDRFEGRIALRPHPGGQYFLKNKIKLRDNVVINNSPTYKVDLSEYLYGISAPSSILIDMVLANIPVAVWSGEGSSMDLGNYEGLASVSSLQDWLAFASHAIEDPNYYLEKQKRFINKNMLKSTFEDVFQRWSSLLSSFSECGVNRAEELEGISSEDIFTLRDTDYSSRPLERVVFVANAYIPTLQLSFIKPLLELRDSGLLEFDFVLESSMKEELWAAQGYNSLTEWISGRFNSDKVSLVVFCRYSGPHYDLMIELVKENHIATIYHIDDDLLGIPDDIGIGKYNFHNNPERLQCVRSLIEYCDLVYCSTEKLMLHLKKEFSNIKIVHGSIYCSGEVINRGSYNKDDVVKIGYMASADHAHNLTVAIDAIKRIMHEYPNVVFEFFGSIKCPSSLEVFGDRIHHAPKIDDYQQFLQHFAEYKWDIGICPLSSIHFNLMKANTKWVEYTSVGAAVVASKGTVYDECCSNGCGLLVDTEDDWFLALERLVSNPSKRLNQIKNAQDKLEREHSIYSLRSQVFEMFQLAGATVKF